MIPNIIPLKKQRRKDLFSVRNAGKPSTTLLTGEKYALLTLNQLVRTARSTATNQNTGIE